jgi:ABC-type transport system substrate-binding protein
MRKKPFSFSPLEKILLAVFAATFFLSGLGLIRAFYIENTQVQPAFGGVFTEGMVGNSQTEFNINPLFAEGISADASNLVFAGLMRFNASNGQIEDYLATHTLSPEKTVYEFTLKENVLWHDGQPVTANDILFTYRDVIQNEKFPGLLLKTAFQDVVIERIDERTVRFTIPEKRKTFFTNFTIGLLPRHQLAGIPVEEMVFAPFNQNPIGCGPYRFDGISPDKDFTALRFSAFPEFFLGRPNVQALEFRVFPSEEQLIAYLPELDAIRPMQSREANEIPTGMSSRFSNVEVISPRYLGVFFNMQNNTLVTKQVRQAMRAAIDTTALAEEYQGERVDTPLVELWPQNDIVNVSRDRANELLEEAGYTFSGEERNVPQEPEETKPDPPQTNKYVSEPSERAITVIGTTDTFLMGSFPQGTTSVEVNGYTLQQFNPSSGRFSYRASTDINTLQSGNNTYTIRFSDANGETIDTEEITIILETDPEKREEILRGLSLLIDTEDQTTPSEPAEEPENPTDTTQESPPEETEEVRVRYRVNESGEKTGTYSYPSQCL